MKLRWEVPDPLAICTVDTADGTRIVLRRHGNPEGPPLVLSHGSGLAIDAYYPFWSLLADRFDLVLYDFRNHGWNMPSDVRSRNFATFVADNEHVLRGIDRCFGAKPRVGVFHSLSATTALNHDPPGEGFAALVLFDPSVYPPSGDLLDIDRQWKRFAVGARMRPERFETRAQLADSIRRSPVYARLLPRVADLLARATLRPAEIDGLWMAPELMSVHGTPFADQLDERAYRALNKWECTSFFSLNVNGIRDLLVA